MHDVDLQIGIVDRQGKLKITDKKFLGIWPVGESREVVIEPKNLEKVYLLADSREGKMIFELFSLPAMGKKVKFEIVKGSAKGADS